MLGRSLSHLDIDACEALIWANITYTGAVILFSQDAIWLS